MLMSHGIHTVGPTRSGAQIEWDKEYAIKLMHKKFPEFTPEFWIVSNEESLTAAFDEIQKMSLEIVVKPQGLSGGKGVKVMGVHLANLMAAEECTRKLLSDRPDESVILVEKIEGVEFTLMVLTDGVSVLRPPATYDYPYRFDGDTGPGTGGMGSFNDRCLPLPFMTQVDYDQCLNIAIEILQVIRAENRHFNGVLNTGFFITEKGLKFLEFNARFGDPECMNIMSVLDGSLSSLLNDIDCKTLTNTSARFMNQASVVKYLVSPDYALKNGERHEFEMDIDAIERMGVDIFFSSAVEIEINRFVTIGNSRCVALVARSNSIQSACDQVETAIRKHVRGPLDWRTDVGSEYKNLNVYKDRIYIT